MTSASSAGTKRKPGRPDSTKPTGHDHDADADRGGQVAPAEGGVERGAETRCAKRCRSRSGRSTGRRACPARSFRRRSRSPRSRPPSTTRASPPTRPIEGREPPRQLCADVLPELAHRRQQRRIRRGVVMPPCGSNGRHGCRPGRIRRNPPPTPAGTSRGEWACLRPRRRGCRGPSRARRRRQPVDMPPHRPVRGDVDDHAVPPLPTTLRSSRGVAAVGRGRDATLHPTVLRARPPRRSALSTWPASSLRIG